MTSVHGDEASASLPQSIFINTNQT